jgi:hypothetical protein
MEQYLPYIATAIFAWIVLPLFAATVSCFSKHVMVVSWHYNLAFTIGCVILTHLYLLKYWTL